MHKIESEADWIIQKNKLKHKYTSLTDGDLIHIEDENELMFLKLQIKLGKTKKELQNIIASL